MNTCGSWLRSLRGRTFRRATSWLLILGFFGSLLPDSLLAASPAPAEPAEAPPIRIALLQRMFDEVNENDARAAMIAWANTMGRERGIPVVMVPDFLQGPEDVRTAFRLGTIDAVTLPVDDYWALRPDLPKGPFIVGVLDGSIEEECVLVVRKDRRFASLAELRGRTLAVHQNLRTCLAPIWLETLLLEKFGELMPDFFGRITHPTKLSRVVLPVFFGQCDAALVTQRGFRLMSELNPQIGEQLVALAISPPVLPAVFCFRPGFDSPYRDKLLRAVGTFHQTSAGQQTLTLFQTDRLAECPVERIASAGALLDRHQQLRLAHQPSGAPGSAPPASPSTRP